MLNTAERFFLMSFCRGQQNMEYYGSDRHVLEGLDEISIMSSTLNQNIKKWMKKEIYRIYMMSKHV